VHREVARVIPDSDLGKGVLVETSILARLLGMKLLTLEGTVVLSPARIDGAGDDTAPPLDSATPTVVARVPSGATGRRSDGADAGDEAEGAIGGRLAAAERLLSGCDQALKKLGSTR
jgi:hypothetical protein